MMQYDTIMPPLRDSVVRKVMDFLIFKFFFNRMVNVKR